MTKGQAQMITRVFRLVVVSSVAAVFPVAAAGAQNNDTVHRHEASTRVEGPPMTLQGVIQEALERNPELAALRDRIAVARQRPAQERSLMPPTGEAQIWQWPINTLNPAN